MGGEVEKGEELGVIEALGEFEVKEEEGSGGF